LDLAAHGLRAPERRPPLPGGVPQTIPEALRAAAERHPGREALVGRSGRLDFAGLHDAARRADSALAALGVEPGDRVAACLPNDLDLVVAFLGVARRGALWVGINRVLAPREKAELLRDCDARLLLATPEVVAELADQPLPDDLEALAVDPSAPGAGWPRRLREAAPAAGRPRADAFDPVAIAYTSGTSGRPKGAVHSHHNLLLPGAVVAASGAFGPEVRQGAVLPLTILNLVVLAPLTALQIGSACVCMDRTDPLGLADWVRRERVGHFAGVPTIFHDLLTHPEVKPEDLASLVRPEVGGAECPESFRRLYRERFGAEVTIGYGMTEAPTAVARSDGAAAPRPGLCGRALPQVELSVRDEQGRALPSGEVGEVCVGPATSGPWAGIYTPMLGYWERPEETARALRDGVYHTGDLGLLDESGQLFLRGRRSELILRGGANVYPAEVERVLRAHPEVADCAVLGVPDERLGERVAAAVVAAAGAAPGPDELRRFALERLARYKVPERWSFETSLPRNAMGKVVKMELRERLGAAGAET